MFTMEQIKEAVYEAVAEAYGVSEGILTPQTHYIDDLSTTSVKVLKMILFTNENLQLDDDEDNAVEFEDVRHCMILQDTIDALAQKYGAE